MSFYLIDFNHYYLMFAGCFLHLILEVNLIVLTG